MKAFFVFQLFIGFGYLENVWASETNLAPFTETVHETKSNAYVRFIIEFNNAIDFESAISEFRLTAADTQVSNQRNMVLLNEIPLFKSIVVDVPSVPDLEYWLSNRTDVKSYFENEATGVIVDTEEGS